MSDSKATEGSLYDYWDLLGEFLVENVLEEYKHDPSAPKLVASLAPNGLTFSFYKEGQTSEDIKLNRPVFFLNLINPDKPMLNVAKWFEWPYSHHLDLSDIMKSMLRQVALMSKEEIRHYRELAAKPAAEPKIIKAKVEVYINGVKCENWTSSSYMNLNDRSSSSRSPPILPIGEIKLVYRSSKD